VVKSIVLSIVAAVVAALAAWIITVNVYTTVMAFRHVVAEPGKAFQLGFEIAGAAAVFACGFAFYGLRRRRRRNASVR
jgi:hypothetical protein